MESRASGWPVLTSQTGPSAMAWTTHRQCRNQLYLQGATPAAPLQGLRTWQHPESSGWLRELCRELRGAVWVPWASPSPRLLGLCRIWADSPRSHGGSAWGGVSSQEPSRHSRHRASGPVGGPPHAHPRAPRGTATYLRVLAARVQASCSGGGEWRRERDGTWR